MSKLEFFICQHCGNIITKIHDASVPVVCCGEPMTKIVANSTDAATEKHVPVVSVEGDTVSVEIGEVEHPMTEEHWIDWICLETEKGFQMVKLDPGCKPAAEFVCVDDKPVAVFAHCNLHGLWTAAI